MHTFIGSVLWNWQGVSHLSNFRIRVRTPSDPEEAKKKVKKHLHDYYKEKGAIVSMLEITPFPEVETVEIMT